MESKYLLFKYVSSASIHVYHIQTYWPVCTHVCTSRYTPYTYACTHIYSCVHTQPLVNASCYFWIRWKWKVKVKVTQSYPTFCDPPLWNSLGQNTGVGSLSLLQQIFPTQELNQGLLHCRKILYQLRQMTHQNPHDTNFDMYIGKFWWLGKGKIHNFFFTWAQFSLTWKRNKANS